MNDQSQAEIYQIKAELERILARNNKVSSDKEWETSLTRKLSIIIITYFSVALTMYLIGVSNFWSSAFIPVLGYYLSTLSLPLIRKAWQK